MKSDIGFAADNDGNIVIQQTTTMTPREFLVYAQQVYFFASRMTVGTNEINLIESQENQSAE